MRRAVAPLVWLLAGTWVSSVASAQTVTKIVDNGDDAKRKVFAVMGDGYAMADQGKFITDVEKLIVGGVLGHDFYAANSKAFNVYRVALVSNDSGISTETRHKDTALHVTYNGRQADCWVTEANDTQALVVAAATTLPKVDFYVVIPNTSGYGGCSSGNVLYITSGSPYTVASHEYGHGLGGLYDEYSADGGANTDARNDLNCSSEHTRTTIVWKNKISSSTPVPTTFAAGMNANATVGAFEGCDFYDTGLFRPVQSCRMKEISRVFCPVCAATMTAAVQPYLPPRDIIRRRDIPKQRPIAFQTPPPAQAAYVNLVLRVLSTGRIEILRAVEVQGAAVGANGIADSLYEVTQNNRVIAAGALPQGWFASHAYGQPGSGTVHSSAPAKSSVLSLTIPDTTLNTLLTANTSLSLDQVSAGVRLQPITPAWVTTLKANNQLKPRASLSAQAFNALLRQRLQTNRGR